MRDDVEQSSVLHVLPHREGVDEVQPPDSEDEAQDAEPGQMDQDPQEGNFDDDVSQSDQAYDSSDHPQPPWKGEWDSRSSGGWQRPNRTRRRKYTGPYTPPTPINPNDYRQQVTCIYFQQGVCNRANCKWFHPSP